MTVTDANSRRPGHLHDAVDVLLPSDPPTMTPGLARALFRLLREAPRASKLPQED